MLTRKFPRASEKKKGWCSVGENIFLLFATFFLSPDKKLTESRPQSEFFCEFAGIFDPFCIFPLETGRIFSVAEVPAVISDQWSLSLGTSEKNFWVARQMGGGQRDEIEVWTKAATDVGSGT
ncbi:hypothetical protein AVEN_163118-1 [Araneus ventricosus]|uniref:Uncharacterized protein n=1 Tax=Araneus ventricosus TaxID=182803 RepID=A0A4Y2DJ77_ARAVE|nr:hypothetical protein AVEN_163118-1 [Araneus ventricosus]